MVIRGLNQLLDEHKLVRTGDLAALHGQRLAFDGHTWLLRKVTVHEPMQLAMGGLPLGLLATVREQVQLLRDAGVRPLFVFSGLNVPRKDRPFARFDHDPRSRRRHMAWKKYLSGDDTKTVQVWSSYVGNPSPTEFLNAILRYFASHDIELFRAPYMSWAQLAYFLRTGIVSGIVGGLECLLFGAQRVILDLNPQNGTYSYVDLREVLASLELVFDQFVDACLLMGFEFIPTFPIIADQQPPNFHHAANFVRAFRNGFAVVQAHAGHPSVMKAGYPDAFLRARALTIHHPILDISCSCEPLDKDGCPADLVEVVGPRLPNVVFYLVSQCAVSNQVINNLVSGVLVEGPPLVSCSEYEKMLDDLVDHRSKTLAFLSASLCDFFQHRRVVTVRWYDPETQVELPHGRWTPAVGRLQSLVDAVRPLALAFVAENGSQKPCTLDQLDLLAVLRLCADRADAAAAAGETLTNDLAPPVVDAPDLAGEMAAVLAGTLVLGLHICGFVDLRLVPTPCGRALLRYGINDPTNAPLFMLLLELIKLNHVSGKQAGTQLQQNVADVEHERQILLISRVLSVLPATLHEAPWAGPVSYSLAAFGCVARALHRSLCHLFEMAMLWIFLKPKNAEQSRPRVGPELATQFAPHLPFFQESSAALGILLEAYLAGASISQMKENFKACTDIPGDLRSAFVFWDNLCLIVEDLAGVGEVSSTLLEEFRTANSFLHAVRERNPVPDA